MTKKRRRCVHLNVMVTPEEQELIYERMAEAGIQNMGAYRPTYGTQGTTSLCSRSAPIQRERRYPFLSKKKCGVSSKDFQIL